jgi:hypothetical protein
MSQSAQEAQPAHAQRNTVAISFIALKRLKVRRPTNKFQPSVR